MNDPRVLYSLFMLLALGTFVLVRVMFRPKYGIATLPWWQQVTLGLAAFVGGVFGAKLPFALSSDESLFSHLAWLGDGKTITTGLVGAYLAVELAKLALGTRVKTGDSFALPLALALAVGRWGCFFNGCCYGTPTELPWGVDFGDGVLRHPTQVYESLFHLAMAGVLFVLWARDRLRYQRIKLYLLAYCGYRFLTEFIRPEPELWAGLTFYQWVSLSFAAFLAVQWVHDERLKRQEGLKNGILANAATRL